MDTPPRPATVLRVADLSPRKPQVFDLRPDAEAMSRLADALGLLGLRKLRFSGEVRADGRSDWRLTAHLGATVTQACVVTLDPVTTRIEETVTRRFLADWPPAAEQGDEVEMPEDETIEALGPEIDLTAVMTEALALALPDYPRVPGAEVETAQAIPPGAAPIDEAETKPFAALAGLKKKLEGGEE